MDKVKQKMGKFPEEEKSKSFNVTNSNICSCRVKDLIDETGPSYQEHKNRIFELYFFPHSILMSSFQVKEWNMQNRLGLQEQERNS